MVCSDVEFGPRRARRQGCVGLARAARQRHTRLTRYRRSSPPCCLLLDEQIFTRYLCPVGTLIVSSHETDGRHSLSIEICEHSRDRGSEKTLTVNQQGPLSGSLSSHTQVRQHLASALGVGSAVQANHPQEPFVPVALRCSSSWSTAASDASHHGDLSVPALQSRPTERLQAKVRRGFFHTSCPTPLQKHCVQTPRQSIDSGLGPDEQDGSLSAEKSW